MKIGRGKQVVAYRLFMKNDEFVFRKAIIENVLDERDLNYIDALEDAVFDLLAFAENMPGFNIHPNTQKALEFMKTKEYRG